MRVMLKVGIPVEVGNMTIQDGTLSKKMKMILDELKPEAAYFAEENGRRTAFVVVNIKEMSEMTRVAEPFFMAFNASVEMHPAMNVDDLMKASAHLEHAAKTYGQGRVLEHAHR